MNENSTVFGESQGILGNLNKTFAPILAAGPNQTGFSTAEDTSLNTEATEQTATNFALAKKAMQEGDAAAGGGDTFEPSGAEKVREGALDATGAAVQSQEQQQILQQNYATGRDNFYKAAGVLGDTANSLNPVGFADAAVNAGSAASKTESDISNSGNSIWSSVFGALGGIGGAAVGKWAKA